MFGFSRIQEVTQSEVEEEIKKLRKLKRKLRNDTGVKRGAYKSNLPPQYKSYQLRANSKQMEFALTVEEFDNIKSLPCTYCGGKSTGIDRVNSKEGYTIENSVPCCIKCNLMKRADDVHDFVNHIKRMYKHLTRE